MKAKFVGFAVAMLCSSVTLASVSESDILAYFSFDSEDLKSDVPSARNLPTWTQNFTPTGASISYGSEAARRYIVDSQGRKVRDGNKFVTFDKSRVFIPLTELSKDASIKQVTVEMFVRGDGRKGADSQVVSAWDTAAWIDKLSSWNWAQDLGARKSDCLACWFQCGDATTGEAYAKVGQKDLGVHPLIFDGQWNHVAVTIDDKTATVYLNYEEVKTLTLDNGWHWHDNADGNGYFLVLGSSSAKSKLAYDEVRITKGVLPKEDWLYVSGELAPADGDTLVYLPFDSSLETLDYPLSDAGYTSTGTPTYDSSVWKRKVVEYGDRQVIVREENAACLKANKSAVTRTLPNPYLRKDRGCDSMTIEFFMKGSSTSGEISTWGSKLVVGKYWSDQKSVSVYPILVQASDDRKYYFRFDTVEAASASFTPDLPLTDGKWHHFAATIEPVESGAKTKISFYADYGEATVKTINGVWSLTDHAKTLSFGQDNNVLWLDELRITKGVLPKSKFLKANNLTGLILTVR